MAQTNTLAAVRMLALALLGVLTVSLALWISYPRLTAVEHLASGRSGPVPLPWVFGEISNGNRLEVSMPVNWLTPRRWHVIPDDRLTQLRVDGQVVPLEGVPPDGLHDWRHGFEIDLGPWLHSGTRVLEFTVDNTAWSGSITLLPRLGWRVPLLAASFLPWLLLLARWFRLRPGQTLILGGALLVLCQYWAVTPWTERGYDIKRYGETGHLGYIEQVVEHGALPRPDQGWEYFQPPLYYLAGALAWRWADWLGLSQTETLRALALGLWLVFLAASAASLRLGLRRSPPVLLLATAALALWPAGIISALRIGNDGALYAAAALAAWFMLRWWRGGRPRHLYAMALCIALAFLCKSSASALFAAAALLLAARLLRRRRWRQARAWAQALAAGALMAGGAALGVARNVWFWRHGFIPNWVNPSLATLDASLRVPNVLRGYIPLDIPVFLTSPWVDSRDDATGRSNFWNFLLRSSLTGEFNFEGALQRFVAYAWGPLLLGLLFLLLRQALRRWPAALAWRDAPWIALGLLWLASLLSLHLKYPFSCHADFRLVLPLLLPFLIAAARGGAWARAALSLIAFGSAVFFIGL